MHLGHIEVLSELLAEERPLFVGITNPDAAELGEQSSSPHRHLQSANPFTFYQRSQMIEAQLRIMSVRNIVTLVPFPLDRPQVWRDYVPLNATQVVRVFSTWELEKVQRLRDGGYKIRVITGDNDSRVSGTDMRAAMDEKRSWRHWTSDPVAALCDTFLADRRA